MLTRLEEFETLTEMVRNNELQNTEEYIPDMLAYKEDLQLLCSRVDRLQAFLARVKQDLEKVEYNIDLAEANAGTSDGKLKNILKPLFFKKPDSAAARHVKSPVYEAPEIFKTSNYFPSDDDNFTSNS
ncbi:biogenesis of lysosome-related organelles complex 1 subunit 4 isoform X2 [Periplaneta americana]